jgi:RNA polymerase sigma-70 factor (ECF subfamily)
MQNKYMDSGDSQALAVLREQLGFVPNLYRAQAILSNVLAAEVRLLDSVLFHTRSLSRVQKECILLVLCVTRQNAACSALHYQTLRLLSVPEHRLNDIVADYRQAKLSPANNALVSVAVRAGVEGAPVSDQDLSLLASHNLNGDAALEAILTAALGNYLCTVATGLHVEPDFAPPNFPKPSATATAPDMPPAALLKGPTLPEDFPPFLQLREQFGFLPKIFPAQSLRPDVIEAEAELVSAILSSNGLLGRKQKEDIFLANDLAFVSDQGCTGSHLVEAVATTGLACFIETLQVGLGLSDLEIRPFPKKPHPPADDLRQTDVALTGDPDLELVAEIRNGNLGAFEELMNRHSRRVYRTLIGILGNAEEARDAMQDTFLKAFQHLPGFEGRSKLSTWLVSIAGNTGIQRLRDRKPWESLDEFGSDSEDGFRPRQVQGWTEDPEQLYSQAETRSLVESGLMKLPAKYRVVVMLRDIEQLSTEESAATLNLGIPALKARLHRGRLMLREALAPHYAAVTSKPNPKGVML